jgi:predicted dinucleotide-binding enzyme
MRIGIIGAGNMGGELGKIWAKNGHHVMFSFNRDPAKLEELAKSAGGNSGAGTPTQAAQFGEVIFLAVPWAAVDNAIKQCNGKLEGKIVISCNNPLKPDLSGLTIGTTISGAEEVARLARGAKVVEVLFPFAEILRSGSVAFDVVKPTQLYCGDDASAKAAVAKLISDIGLEPVDAGPLRSARYLEPLGILMVQLAYVQGVGVNIGTSSSNAELDAAENASPAW